MRQNKRIQSILQLLMIIGILIFVNIIGNFFFAKLDLTEDKRFTLTDGTKKLLKKQENILYVQVLLEGEFPAGFKRLQEATREMLNDFRGISPQIEYQFIDPTDGSTEEVNARKKELAKDGITPTNLRFGDQAETVEKLIYPFAVFSMGERSVAVNLLENNVPGMNPEIVLNNSVGLLEYKFANAIQKLQIFRKPSIVFSQGQGELYPQQTVDLEKNLRAFYDTGRVDLDSIYALSKEIDIFVVAKPRGTFTERNKFILDQYVMNGGKVIWLIDRLAVDLDSLRNRDNSYLARDYPLNLEDQWYKYGFRIQPNYVLDLECSRIPNVVGKLGSSNQIELKPWYYNPLVAPTSFHPIVKSLGRVNLFYPSTIDTIRTKTNVKKTILLESSVYTKIQPNITRLNFEILRVPVDETKFNKGPQPLAVLLEGEFPSLFQNRVTEGMMSGMESLNLKYREKSVKTKMLVVSDGDVAANLFNAKSGEYRALGYNQFERQVFSNKNFMVNAIEYMLDENGVIDARAKEVKLRMLDKVKPKKEKTFWQLINIIAPLFFLALFGFIFYSYRKRRYA